jgi:hypothetical protein
MKIRLPSLVATLAFCFIAVNAQSQELVAEFHGSRNTTTREFVVQGPWILDWRVTGDYSTSVGFELMLLDGKTRMHKGVVLRLKRAANGVKLFNEGGTYRFRISSGLAKYHLKVEEISAEEAKLYTPRGGS